MTTPKNARSVWFLVNVVLVLLIPAHQLWLTRVIREEYQHGVRASTAADSIGLPVEAFRWWLLWIAIAVNIILWFALRPYPGRIALFYRVRATNWRVRVVELISLIAGAGTVFLVLNSAYHRDWEFAVLGVPWIYLVLVFRAIIIHRVSREPGG